MVFDLDGTLVDTAPDLIGTLNEMLVLEGYAPVPLASARHLVGNGARAMLRHGFAEAGAAWPSERDPELFDSFIARYRERIADESRAFPGCEAALAALSEAGAILAVCTNKPTDLSLLLLDRLGLRDRFAAILGADAVPARKPDPGHVRATVEAASGDMARAVFVGDSAVDAAAARAAGLAVVGVSFGYRDRPAADLGFDLVIDTLAEAPDACARLLNAARRGLPETGGRATSPPPLGSDA